MCLTHLNAGIMRYLSSKRGNRKCFMLVGTPPVGSISDRTTASTSSNVPSWKLLKTIMPCHKIYWTNDKCRNRPQRMASSQLLMGQYRPVLGSSVLAWWCTEEHCRICSVWWSGLLNVITNLSWSSDRTWCSHYLWPTKPHLETASWPCGQLQQKSTYHQQMTFQHSSTTPLLISSTSSSLKFR